MKNSTKSNFYKLLIIIGGIFIFFCTSSNIQAQELKKENLKSVNMLADTTFLKAYEITLEPGETGALHSHPNHFFYTLSAKAELMVHYKDGRDAVPYNLKIGDFGVLGPEGLHKVENVGTTVAKYLVVEIKD